MVLRVVAPEAPVSAQAETPVRKIELVCPAGSLPALKAAVDEGADCVYLGFRDATNAVREAMEGNTELGPLVTLEQFKPSRVFSNLRSRFMPG